jgi:hypothetical protein
MILTLPTASLQVLRAGRLFSSPLDPLDHYVRPFSSPLFPSLPLSSMFFTSSLSLPIIIFTSSFSPRIVYSSLLFPLDYYMCLFSSPLHHYSHLFYSTSSLPLSILASWKMDSSLVGAPHYSG